MIRGISSGASWEFLMNVRQYVYCVTARLQSVSGWFICFLTNTYLIMARSPGRADTQLNTAVEQIPTD